MAFCFFWNIKSLYFNYSHAYSFVLSLAIILSHLLPFLLLVAIRCQSLSFVVTCCTTRCHSLHHSLSLAVIRCYSLSFVVPLIVIRCHSLSFVITQCTSSHSSVFLWTILYFRTPFLYRASSRDCYWWMFPKMVLINLLIRLIKASTQLNIYLFQVKKRNTRKRCEMTSFWSFVVF